jgi:hypothetical protein
MDSPTLTRTAPCCYTTPRDVTPYDRGVSTGSAAEP